MELGVGEIDLKKSEGVRDLLGRRAHPGHAVGHPEDGRDWRSMCGAQAVEQEAVAVGALGGEGEEQAALRAEALHQSGGREARFACDVGQGHPHRPNRGDGAQDGGEDGFVGSLARSRAHSPAIMNARSQLPSTGAGAQGWSGPGHRGAGRKSAGTQKQAHNALGTPFYAIGPSGRLRPGPVRVEVSTEPLVIVKRPG
jgi:hypothetical protein